VSSLAHALPTQELVLDRYRAVRPLGSGGNGSVWLARDEVTGLDVALKIVPREGKAAARAEARRWPRRLRHERCVRYDVGHDMGHVTSPTSMFPAVPFFAALLGRSIDPDAVEIGARVSTRSRMRTRTASSTGMSPLNILLSTRGSPSVARLGLAQFDGADTSSVWRRPRTLAYIAPERLAGDDAAPASDVWAVGVLLWESLAGQHPFWGMPLQEVALAIERGAPPLVERRADLPRRLLAAVDAALASEPADRPHASALAGELRAAIRPSQANAAPHRAPRKPAARAVPAVSLGSRAAPAVLAAATAAVGVTLLPFWPPALALAVVAIAATAAFRNPRLGLAAALAAPVFPLGNYAQGAAILYSVFAAAWLALFWREARLGLLFIVGPLLAAFGALALVPLAMQPIRGTALRAAQAALAVLSAGLIAVLAGDTPPVGGDRIEALDIGPSDTAQAIAVTLSSAIASNPVLPAAALVAALAASLLPWARRRSRYGVAVIGAVLVAGAIATGAGVAATLLVVAVWGTAAALAAGTRR
jgi:hypothetical protein